MLNKLKFIYRCLKAQYRDQSVEITELTRQAPPDSCLLDIGSNKGSYLLAMSKAVPKGQVFAFEPQPILAEYLHKMVQSCNLSNVKVFNQACSDNQGILPLHIPGNAPTSPGATLEPAIIDHPTVKTVDVTVVRLDDMLKSIKNIAAVKIDVEGHELSVIRGMQQLIFSNKPVIVCEIEQRHLPGKSIYEVLSEILALGYKGAFVKGKSLIPIEEFDLSIHQRSDGERFWDKKDYCNNFIFHPI